MVEIPWKSGFPINQDEDNGEEDYEVPTELERLIEHEEKEIRPYKEPIEVINLSSTEVWREVKIVASLAEHVHGELVKLLHEYIDVFSWYYQDMSGLDTNII